MSEDGPSDLRLAPRRVLVLLHLSAHGDATSREVAADIGVVEEAEACRLLAGMRDIGLVVNRAPADSHALPNAWELTADGRRLVRALEEIGAGG